MLLLALWPAIAASEETNPFSYYFLSANYAASSPSDGLDADGYSIGGSTPLSDKTVLTGSYSRLETDEITDPLAGTGSAVLSSYSVGLGWHRSLSRLADFSWGASYIHSKAKGTGAFEGSGSLSGDGYGVDASLRTWVTRRTEMTFGGGYESVGDQDGMGFSVGMILHLTRRFGAGASFSFDDESTGWSGGLRMSFG